ncbi:MAG: TIGR03936 family radical SAM-associated protein [Gemmatales bacterium]|nr:TIGR03936 family radical SAM-associated protein [Gemmatales bacterium]MDW8221687.1 TIGR03936 family radical SAM-associated protein [Gemmatales bacterium]
MTTHTKARIRFRKIGDLRFFSHHDLMRMFERMLRRANLPFRLSEGFHPMPRMVFASALGLGIAGLDEVVEIEFTQPLAAAEIERRLAEQAPPGLQITSVRLIDPRQQAQPIRATYRFPIPDSLQREISHRVVELHQQPQWWVERIRILEGGAHRPDPATGDMEVPLVAPVPRRQVRSLDIRPFVERLWIQEGFLYFTCRITPQGSARAEEILRLLDLETLLDAGYVLERTALQLDDETILEDYSS